MILFWISGTIYGNDKIDFTNPINQKHRLSINPVSPFISIFNINYGYRIQNRNLEMINSLTYFNNIAFKATAGFYVVDSDLNAVNYLISLRKYKNANLNRRFYGIGIRSLYIRSHDSDVTWFLPLSHSVPGMRLPKSFYIKNIFVGVSLETGYTISFQPFLLTFSASVATGFVSENIDNTQWDFIKKMVFFPSINLTAGWQF